MKPKRKKTNGFLLAGIVITAAVFLALLIGTFYTPMDPDAMSAAEKLLPPSFSHLFGTDQFGRDIFSRVLRGAGTTCTVALATVAIGASVGTLVGAVTGYFGGFADEALMRLNDSVTAFPAVLLALVAISLAGPGNTYHLILALGLVFIPSYARVMRAAFASLRTRSYIVFARLNGAKHGRLLAVHLLPNTLPVLLPALTVGFNNAVLAEAGMSFLGVGVTPPEVSLGYMLSESQGMLAAAPWYALTTGAVLVVTVFGVGLIGEGLQKTQ